MSSNLIESILKKSILNIKAFKGSLGLKNRIDVNWYENCLLEKLNLNSASNQFLFVEKHKLNKIKWSETSQ